MKETTIEIKHVKKADIANYERVLNKGYGMLRIHFSEKQSGEILDSLKIIYIYLVEKTEGK